MQILSVYLLFLSTVSVSYAYVHRRSASLCDRNNFQKCSSEFYSAVGAQNVGLKGLSFLLETMQQTKDGLDAMCTAAVELKECVGAEFESCMSPQHWVSLGLSAGSAMEMSLIFHQTVHGCLSPQIEVFKNHFDCWRSANETSYSTQQLCAVELSKQFSAQPAQACSHADKFNACIAAPFYEKCGPEMGKVICEESRYAMQNVVLKSLSCNLTCN